MDRIWSNRIYIFSWCHLSMWSVQLQKSHLEAMLWLQSFLYPWDPAVVLQFTYIYIVDGVTFIFTPPFLGFFSNPQIIHFPRISFPRKIVVTWRISLTTSLGSHRWSCSRITSENLDKTLPWKSIRDGGIPWSSWGETIWTIKVI